MKTFVKILVAIIVVAAICGGVYLVLPETAQIFVRVIFSIVLTMRQRTR